MFYPIPCVTKEVSHQVYDSVAKDAKQTKQAALMLEHSDIEDLAFIESRDFTGARKGYVFGTGPQGTGFYRDRAQLAQPWAQPAAPVATEAEEEAPEEEVSNEVQFLRVIRLERCSLGLK